MKDSFKRAIDVVRRHRRAYLRINLAFYGLVAFGAVLVVAFPRIQQSLFLLIQEALGRGPLKPVALAYQGGNVLSAAGLTFAINLVGGSLFTITIPSLIVPFSGCLLGFVRAAVWGLALSPADPHLRWAMIPHSLTLLLEGQGYVLAMLGAYVQGRSWLQPRSVGKESAAAGFVAGLRATASIYLLVAAVLAVAAAYEALEVIYLAPLLVSH